MKWVKKDSGFLLSFFINLLFNLEWAIPAVICFVLYFNYLSIILNSKLFPYIFLLH